MRIAIACSKDWFLRNQKKNIKKYFLIKNKSGLNYKNLKKKKLNIFFSHIGVTLFQKKFMKILIV